jgi:hypothetical protein
MSHQIVETTRLPASDLTFGRAKSMVARTIGSPEDSDALAAAGDALQMAVAEWNRRYAFDWFAKTHTDITVSAGTDTYDLPQDFLKEYSVRMTSNDRPLKFVRQRLYDRSWWDQSSQSFTTHYTLWGEGQSGNITLMPMPGESDVLSIRYYAKATTPSHDDDKFGLPDRYVYGLVYKAKAFVLLDRDAENVRAQFWLAEAEKAFREARADDEYHPDEDEGFVPNVEHGSITVGPNNPYYYMGGPY